MSEARPAPSPHINEVGSGKKHRVLYSHFFRVLYSHFSIRYANPGTPRPPMPRFSIENVLGAEYSTPSTPYEREREREREAV
jgi:hypothetical protein